jgi:hypothetical protein
MDFSPKVNCDTLEVILGNTDSISGIEQLAENATF